jgi:hypothetical protein
MPVTQLLSRHILKLGPKYLFDWTLKVWVQHLADDESKNQFWLEVVPATAKLLTDFGLRDEHLLKAIEPIPSWPSKVVMFYMGTKVAAALVERPPEKSVTPSWWFKEPYPTRFEREDVI